MSTEGEVIRLKEALRDNEAAYVRANARADKANEALRKAERTISEITEIVENTLEECGKYPDPEGPIKCGWKNSVLSIKEAL